MTQSEIEAELRYLQARANQQPISYKPLFDMAMALARMQVRRHATVEDPRRARWHADRQMRMRKASAPKCP